MGCVLPRFHGFWASYFSIKQRKQALLKNGVFPVQFCQSAKGKSKLWVIGSFHVFAKKLVFISKLRSILDFFGGPPILNFLLYFDQKLG